MKEEIIKVIKYPEVFKKGNFNIRDGANSEIYIDIKKAYGIPGFLSNASKEIQKIINPKTTCVAGMGIGGISLASVYGELYDIPVCLIRDNPKSRGTKNQIEGYSPKKGDKIVILDDVFTTGSSLKDTAQIISTTKAELIQACVILTRNEPNLNFPIKSVLNLKDIL